MKIDGQFGTHVFFEGNRLLTINSNIKVTVLNLKSGELKYFGDGLSGNMVPTCISPHGRTFACSNYTAISFWNIAEGIVVSTIDYEQTIPKSVLFGIVGLQSEVYEDGEDFYLAYIDNTNTIMVCKLPEGTEIFRQSKPGA